MELSRIAALAEMASGIAHELNQPLGAIATFSQAGDRLLNRPEPMVSRAREVFQQINQEALNAGEGIRRIRRLFDHAEPKRSRCQMSDLVSEVVPALQALARAADIVLKVDVQASLPEVSVDRLRIQLVLFSLVQNALEASAQNSGSQVLIEVRADRYAVEISIMDSGKGITDRACRQAISTVFHHESRAERVWDWHRAVRRSRPTRGPLDLRRSSPWAVASGFVCLLWLPEGEQPWPKPTMLCSRDSLCGG